MDTTRPQPTEEESDHRTPGKEILRKKRGQKVLNRVGGKWRQ